MEIFPSKLIYLNSMDYSADVLTKHLLIISSLPKRCQNWIKISIQFFCSHISITSSKLRFLECLYFDLDYGVYHFKLRDSHMQLFFSHSAVWVLLFLKIYFCFWWVIFVNVHRVLFFTLNNCTFFYSFYIDESIVDTFRKKNASSGD